MATDINGDGRINIIDISTVAKAFGSNPENPRWNPECDVDANNVINIMDISRVARDFGKTY